MILNKINAEIESTIESGYAHGIEEELWQYVETRTEVMAALKAAGGVVDDWFTSETYAFIILVLIRELVGNEGKIRFNAARFRELAKMADIDATRGDNIYSHCHHRGKAQAFKLAAAQTDSMMTDDYADFLEAEEKKDVLEELLEKARAEISDHNLDEYRVDGYTAGWVGGVSMLCKWIENALSEGGE